MRAVRPMGRTGSRAQPAWPAQRRYGKAFSPRKGSSALIQMRLRISDSSRRRIVPCSIERRSMPCYKAAPALRPSTSMKLISIPANPVPDERRRRHLQDAGRRRTCASRAWRRRPAARARSACFRAAPSSSRNISRPCANCARAALRSRRFDWRGQGLSQRALRDRAQGPRAQASANTPPISKPSCARSCCRIVRRRSSRRPFDGRRDRHPLLPTTAHRWFERMVLCAPMIALRGRRRLTGIAGPLRAHRCGYRARLGLCAGRPRR